MGGCDRGKGFRTCSGAALPGLPTCRSSSRAGFVSVPTVGWTKPVHDTRGEEGLSNLREGGLRATEQERKREGCRFVSLQLR